jgi:hypothetical protein
MKAGMIIQIESLGITGRVLSAEPAPVTREGSTWSILLLTSGNIKQIQISDEAWLYAEPTL